jgi:hypothetical protein
MKDARTPLYAGLRTQSGSEVCLVVRIDCENFDPESKLFGCDRS